VFDVLADEGTGESVVAVAGAVVGEDSLDGEAELGVVGFGHEEEAQDGCVGLVGQDGGEGDAAMVVDGAVEILGSGAAGLPSSISHGRGVRA
jgi:hypothetical protein